MARVAVIMAAYNAAATVEDSIRSIIHQSYTDWVLVVVNDASSDETPHLLQKYENDVRIQVVNMSENMGGAGARAAGISVSDSEFIAIQDADDISHTRRLEWQVAAFDEDPELSVVGGQIADFGTWGGPEMSYAWPTKAEDIRERLLSGKSPLADCTAMIRRSAFEEVGGYDPLLKRVYDLGLYLCMRNMKMIALPELILNYRTARPISLRYCILEGRYRALAINRHLTSSGPQSCMHFPASFRTDLRSIAVCLLRRWRERRRSSAYFFGRIGTRMRRIRQHPTKR